MLSYGQKHIMLSAVYIREKKTYIRISFSPNHRHRTIIKYSNGSQRYQDIYRMQIVQEKKRE